MHVGLGRGQEAFGAAVRARRQAHRGEPLGHHRAQVGIVVDPVHDGVGEPLCGGCGVHGAIAGPIRTLRQRPALEHDSFPDLTRGPTRGHPAPMIVTPLYAGLLALFYLVLSARVISRRRGAKISLGDGGDAQLQRRARAHGNFAEYAPFALLLIALLEIGGTTPSWLLHALGLGLLVGRLLHGIALSFTEHWFPGRFFGVILTFLVLLVAGVLLLWRGIAGLILAAG
jgi:uncharacterized protein